MKSKGERTKRLLLISFLLCVLIVGFTWSILLPWNANHFSFALPGAKGLPWRIRYNGRDYDTIATCAYAHWCEQENGKDRRDPEHLYLPDQKTVYSELCMKVSDIQQFGDWPLVQVSSIWTLGGHPQSVMANSYLLRKPVTFGTPVWGMNLYVFRDNNCYTRYTLSGGP